MKGHSLGILSCLLLCAGVSLYGQNLGTAVSFSSKVHSVSVGSYAELSFVWGNGKVVSVSGDSQPLTFDAQMYTSGVGMDYLQSRPFVLNGASRSVSFGLGYKFFIEAFKKTSEFRNQGLMVLDLELYDVRSGEVHPRRTSLLEECSIDIASGKDYEGSALTMLSIDVDPEWVSSKPREVALRVVFSVIPGELVAGAVPSVVSYFPEDLSNYSFQ